VFVIQVHALAPPEVERIDMCLAAATESVAMALTCPPSQVWAQYIPVAAMHMGTRPRRFNGHRPVVVLRGPTKWPDAQIRAAITSLANSVSVALDLSIDEVWVQWVGVEPGKLFCGGRILNE
jgi:hypothetical protein